MTPEAGSKGYGPHCLGVHTWADQARNSPPIDADACSISDSTPLVVDSEISTTGVFMGTDEPAGDVVTGSF
jgi:hypothetical protein